MFRLNVFKKALVVLVMFAVLLVGINGIPGAVDLQKANVAQAAVTKAPKYVFYFIGDGLGTTQRTVAEYYLQEKNKDKTLKLAINTLPHVGINTTHSADTLVTDSAAAGTALATGYKTNNGVISQLPNGVNVKTLVELAEEKGMATGLVSTTRITHATPAVFAAHNVSRNNENEIAVDFLDSGVDFFAGGGYRHFIPQNTSGLKSKRKDGRNLVSEFREMGYKTFISESSSDWFKMYEPKGQEKVFAAFTYSHMPYEIDRVNTNNPVPSLAEMTEKGIEVLAKYDNGFLMMVEGGRIDHAGHANDAAGNIRDTLAFDKAVKKALEFYKKYPDETLLVVVGDHETGGMGLGFAKNYWLKIDELFDAKVSVDDTLNKIYNGDREAFFTYIAQNLGLDDLTTKEKAEIEKAMDIQDSGMEYDVAKYGPSYYSPVAIATTHVLSNRANLEWTTYAHSGTAIPFGAIGVGSENFSGYKDNTDIAKTLADLMGFKLGLLQ